MSVAYVPPTTEPTRLTAGATWRWTKVVADFPASAGWTLRYAFTGPSAFAFAATADGDGYTVTRTPTDTALPAGTYRWISYVTNVGGERYDVGSGILVVAQNLAAVAAGTEQLTWAERTLAVVEAALEGRLATGLEEYQIAGKAIKHIPATELYTLRAKLRHEVQHEKSGGAFGRVEVTFGVA